MTEGMKVIFLGTGTGVPAARRASPGLAVLVGGAIFLVDGGAGTLRQLAKAGISYSDVDYIFYTHYHPDHVGDLVSYLFASRASQSFTRTTPCRIYGPVGLLDLYANLGRAFGHWVAPPEHLVLMEELPITREHEFYCGDTLVRCGPVTHTPYSLGYRFRSSGGLTMVVTGDTDYGPLLLQLASDADLLVTECSFPEGKKVDGHLTPGLAGRAAREARVKALALTHFYPETEGHDLLGPAQKEFAGPITLAEDLMSLVL
jgi:ribonuclease BN (tRNA processing enzyme)